MEYDPGENVFVSRRDFLLVAGSGALALGLGAGLRQTARLLPLTSPGLKAVGRAEQGRTTSFSFSPTRNASSGRESCLPVTPCPRTNV
jgi:hypothetical protein